MKNFQQKSLDDYKEDRSVLAPPVSDYMTKKIITFKPETPIKEVVNTLLTNRITGAPVLNDRQEVVGLIDDKDCLNILFGDVYHRHPVGQETVASYMSNVMKTISIKTDILEVANIFLTTPYKRLLVMDDNGKLAGQISRRDILRAIQELKKI